MDTQDNTKSDDGTGRGYSRTEQLESLREYFRSRARSHGGEKAEWAIGDRSDGDIYVQGRLPVARWLESGTALNEFTAHVVGLGLRFDPTSHITVKTNLELMTRIPVGADVLVYLDVNVLLYPAIAP